MAAKPMTDIQCIDTMNAIELYGTTGKASIALNIPRATLQSRANTAKMRGIGSTQQVEVKKLEPKEKQGLKIAVIPDCQVKPGIPLDYLSWIGRYLAEKKPDIIVNIGDFADMCSLSSYDIGKKSYEGRSYKADITAAKDGMTALMTPINEERNRTGWNPRLEMLLGNHEDRIHRAIELDRKLEGLMKMSDLGYEKAGWTVHPFLEVLVIENIAFSHYFTSGVMGRPVCSAAALLTKKHMSCIAGHQQGRQIAYGRRADGCEMTAIISGSCYLHEEGFLGPQGNQHFRGMYFLHDTKEGSFDEMALSLNYLRRRYETNLS